MPASLSPKEITEKFIDISIAKTSKSLRASILLGILAGIHIGLGAVFYTIVKSDASLSFAVKQILGGLVFCVGLILVVVAGSELFTGNNLITIGWANKKVTIDKLLKNWVVIFFSNAVGAILLAFLIYYSGHTDMNGGKVGEMYVKMANGKCSLPFDVAFIRGVLCNFLVCLAVWMAVAGKTTTDKVIGILFPITLFVAAGFEHSIANLFIIPLGLILKMTGTVGIEAANLTTMGAIGNIIPVALGNIVGGAIFVGLLYNLIYKKW